MKKHKTFWLISLIAIAASVPLMTGYAPAGVNLQATLSRIEAVRQGLGSVFPIRVNPLAASDYGFSAASFEADVFYWVPALFRLAGLSLTAAWQLTLFAANLVTASVAYLCFRKCFHKPEIGLVGSLLYTWCPCRLNEMYVSADLGRVAAWCFLPLILSGLVSLFTVDAKQEEYGRLWTVLTLGFSLVLVSSTSLFFVAAGMTVLFLLFMGRQTIRKQTLLVLGRTAGATLLVNVWFLLPMLARLRHLPDAELLIPRDIRSGGMYLPQYLSIFLWGGDGTSLYENGMAGAQATSPGIAVTALALIYLWASFTGRYQMEEAQRRLGRGLLQTCLVLILFSCNSFPWDLLQNQNRLFSTVLSFMRTPSLWGVTACAGLIAAACLTLNRLGTNKAVLAATAAASFGTAQFFLGNLLRTRAYMWPGGELPELLPFQILTRETLFWRLCEVVSALALCGCLAPGILRRRKHAEQV